MILEVQAGRSRIGPMVAARPQAAHSPARSAGIAQKERQTVQRCEEPKAGRIAPCEGARAEEPQRQHWSRARLSQATKATNRTNPAASLVRTTLAVVGGPTPHISARIDL